MTIKAAGIMLLCRTGDGETALFVKRGEGSDYPGCWAFPGGRCEDGEALEECAERETREEIGPAPYSGLAVWTRRVAAQETTGVAPTPPTGAPPDGLPSAPPGDAIVVPGEQVDFTTFAARVKDQFRPTLGDEHTGWAWGRVDQPPEPLHPGCRIALDRLGMDELGIARAIAAGELTSPQRYLNVWLFAIRITGTGLSYRSSIKEYVWRDQSIYLNDDFLARCNGLAVIIEHPKGALNTKEYKDRNIGSIMLPYIQGSEVWGIAKIYDANAAHLMETEQLSTSPMVVLGSDTDDNTKLILESGKPLLVEGTPILLDHVAVVPNGVWDKGGDPTGVLAQAIGDSQVAEETEAERKAREEREDAARRDASGNIDKLLSHLDAMSKRMDAMEASDKARRDADEKREREDAQRRRDAEREDWHKKDAAACERDDAEEAEEREKMEKEGEAKEVAADKARKSRRDRMDARRRDAESAEEREKKDAKEKAEREDAARRDAEARETKERADALQADQRTLAERLALMPKPPTDADYPAMADAQSRADQAYGAFGQRAPTPLQGETALAYRVRLARGLQKHSKPWSGVELHVLPDTALGIAEGQIYADAVVASRSPDGLPDFALVPHSYTNPDTGHRITEWRGKHTFIWGLKRPSLRATAFMTGKGN